MDPDSRSNAGFACLFHPSCGRRASVSKTSSIFAKRTSRSEIIDGLADLVAGRQMFRFDDESVIGGFGLAQYGRHLRYDWINPALQDMNMSII